MPNKNPLSQFWQELKRRKVIYVVTVYASAAFVLIELVNNVVEPLNLPERTSTFVIIALAIGFPIAIIMSWIFDITPKGMEKTKPLPEGQEKKIPASQNRWKVATYISIAVIIGLIILNIAGDGTKLKAGDIQSLVVLPFENFTGDDQLENVVSGMHALLVGNIGRISEVRVLGKTTSNAYKDVDISATEIASELNVDAVVEASVMCFGDSVCMQFRLVRTIGEEQQLWIADYNEDKSQIFNLYNQITKQIADEIMIELTPEEERLLAKSRTVDREAFDEYLKARLYWDDFSEESLNKALDYLNRAIEKEPDWAPLYTGLANVWIGIQQMGYKQPSVASPKIYENITKALELDPDLSDSHYLSGLMAHVMEWNWEKSEREFLKALAINPNDALSRIFYAQLLGVLLRHDEALLQGKLAFELDPLNPNMKSWYGALLAGVGDCETSLTILEDVVAADPENYLANAVIELAGFLCKDYNKAIKAARYALPIPVDEDSYKEIERIFREQSFTAAYEEIMKRIEAFASSHPINPAETASRYIMANQPDKAMDWLEKGFEIHDPQVTYLLMTNFDPLFNNPRFINLVQKMNLPLPTAN